LAYLQVLLGLIIITISAKVASLLAYDKVELIVLRQRIKEIYIYNNKGVASCNVLYSHYNLILL
jgi:hypothetical protein